MSRLDLESLYKRALKHGRCNRLGDEAQDFAQWLMLQYLEGKSQHQTLDQSLIDYLRKQHGGSRNPGSRAKYAARLRTVSLSPVGTRETETQWIDNHIERERGGVEESQRNDFDFREVLKGKLALVWEYYSAGIDTKRIGSLLGVSESRISQLLGKCTGLIYKSQKQAHLARIRTAIESTPTEFEVEWVSL